MADITMCNDKECPKQQQCYRAQAPVTPHWQAYFVNSPRDKETNECKEFWDKDNR